MFGKCPNLSWAGARFSNGDIKLLYFRQPVRLREIQNGKNPQLNSAMKTLVFSYLLGIYYPLQRQRLSEMISNKILLLVEDDRNNIYHS